MLTRNNLLPCNTHDFIRKKNFFFLHTKPLKYNTQAFHKREVQVISIRLNKPNIHYVKHNNFNCTKLMMLIFTRKTHFLELRNSEYLCRLQPNYDWECKKLTRINLLRSNTYDFTRKNILFFYIQNHWKMILRPLIRKA
jgi:hypothetical protein